MEIKMKKLIQLFLTFLKIGAFTFGGGYAMIALLENEFIEKKKWIDREEFLNMVAVAESTPGTRGGQQCDLSGLQSGRCRGSRAVNACREHTFVCDNISDIAFL